MPTTVFESVPDNLVGVEDSNVRKLFNIIVRCQSLLPDTLKPCAHQILNFISISKPSMSDFALKPTRHIGLVAFVILDTISNHAELPHETTFLTHWSMVNDELCSVLGLTLEEPGM